LIAASSLVRLSSSRQCCVLQRIERGSLVGRLVHGRVVTVDCGAVAGRRQTPAEAELQSSSVVVIISVVLTLPLTEQTPVSQYARRL